MGEILSLLLGSGEKIYRFIKNKIIRTTLFWRGLWWLKNEKIDLELKEIRTYNNQYFNLPTGFDKVVSKALLEYFDRIEESIIGENYLIVRVNKLNVPLKIEIALEIGPSFEDEEIEEKILGTVISIKTFGTLTFTYREAKKYENTLLAIDKIFEEAEIRYGFQRKTVKYHVLATLSNKPTADYPIPYEQTRDWDVSIGRFKVIINSKKKEPVLRIFREYLPITRTVS